MPHFVIACACALILAVASSHSLAAREFTSAPTPAGEVATEQRETVISEPRVDELSVQNSVNKVVLALLLALAPSEVPAATVQETSVDTPANEAEPLMLEEDEQASDAVPGHFVLQGEYSVMASDLIGAMVYSRERDVVGEITDVVVNLSGGVDGVVIGVGGFLGLGEKRIAVKLEALDVIPEANGRVRVVVNASRQAVEEAPDFKSLSQQRFELEVEREMKELEEKRSEPPEAQ